MVVSPYFHEFVYLGKDLWIMAGNGVDALVYVIMTADEHRVFAVHGLVIGAVLSMAADVQHLAIGGIHNDMVVNQETDVISFFGTQPLFPIERTDGVMGKLLAKELGDVLGKTPHELRPVNSL